VVTAGLGFVVVLFSLDVHQIKLINQTAIFKQRQCSVYGRKIDIPIVLFGNSQQVRRIQMPGRVLNDGNEQSPLPRYSDPS